MALTGKEFIYSTVLLEVSYFWANVLYFLNTCFSYCCKYIINKISTRSYIKLRFNKRRYLIDMHRKNIIYAKYSLNIRPRFYGQFFFDKVCLSQKNMLV